MSSAKPVTNKILSADSSANEVLAKNIRHLMHVRNIDSQSLSKKTGIALTTINGLRRGYGNPTLSTITELANFFNVTIGNLTEKEISILDKNMTKIYEIPLIELDEAENFTNKSIKFKDKKIITTELDNSINCGNGFCIEIKNNSMAPFFSKKTIFVVIEEGKIHDGDMVLVKFGNNIPCFRIVYLEGDSYFFKAITEKNEKNILKPNEFKIIGIVIKAIQTITER